MRNKLKKILTISSLVAMGSLSASAEMCLGKDVPADAGSLEKPLAIGEKALVFAPNLLACETENNGARDAAADAMELISLLISADGVSPQNLYGAWALALEELDLDSILISKSKRSVNYGKNGRSALISSGKFVEDALASVTISGGNAVKFAAGFLAISTDFDIAKLLGGNAKIAFAGTGFSGTSFSEYSECSEISEHSEFLRVAGTNFAGTILNCGNANFVATNSVEDFDEVTTEIVKKMLEPDEKPAAFSTMTFDYDYDQSLISGNAIFGNENSAGKLFAIASKSVIADDGRFATLTWDSDVIVSKMNELDASSVIIEALGNIEILAAWEFEVSKDADAKVGVDICLGEDATLTSVADIVIFHGVTVDGVTTWEDVTTSDMISGIAFDAATGVISFTTTSFSDYAVALKSGSSPIPEPQAFSLLAGTGALAFAGTQRRRRILPQNFVRALAFRRSRDETPTLLVADKPASRKFKFSKFTFGKI